MLISLYKYPKNIFDRYVKRAFNFTWKIWRRTSNLFWKLYLSILLVVILTSILASYIVKHVTLETSVANIDKHITMLMAFEKRLAEQLVEDNVSGAVDILTKQPDYASQFYVFDDWGNEILGRYKTPQVNFRTSFDQAIDSDFIKRNIVLDVVVNSRSGEVYHIDVYPSIKHDFLFSPSVAGDTVRVLLLVVFSAIVCYLLTHPLIVRIENLRRVSRQVAAGNLDVQIKDKVLLKSDELSELSQEFNVMIVKLRDVNELRRQILSDISHELRSPLARIAVALEIGRIKLPDSEQLLDRIEKEASQLNQMISQIITIQNLQSKLGIINKQPIDLIVLLKEIITDAKFEFSTQNKDVVLNSKVASAYINADIEHLRSALENVIRNAMLYTADNTCVEVNLTNNAKSWILEVIDYGVGVDSSQLEAIFQAFTRLDSSRTRGKNPVSGRGFGLGLAIAKSVIEAHNGSIFARNAIGHSGLVVQIKLDN